MTDFTIIRARTVVDGQKISSHLRAERTGGDESR